MCVWGGGGGGGEEELYTPLGQNYFNFMGEFQEIGQNVENKPHLGGFEPPSRYPGSPPAYS